MILIFSVPFGWSLCCCCRCCCLFSRWLHKLVLFFRLLLGKWLPAMEPKTFEVQPSSKCIWTEPNCSEGLRSRILYGSKAKTQYCLPPRLLPTAAAGRVTRLWVSLSRLRPRPWRRICCHNFNCLWTGCVYSKCAYAIGAISITGQQGQSSQGQASFAVAAGLLLLPRLATSVPPGLRVPGANHTIICPWQAVPLSRTTRGAVANCCQIAALALTQSDSYSDSYFDLGPWAVVFRSARCTCSALRRCLGLLSCFAV